jgi:tRNA 2-(methylsulfanyl)-N6-isopentenyladenosine37 hydroxylase
MLRLMATTDPAWIEHALAHLDEVLVDHAHCEHKAAASALSLVSRYGDDPVLVDKLCALAGEEASHLAMVARVCAARGLSLGRPAPDPYVNALRGLVRGNVLDERVDRLLVSSLVEARSCERLQLLAEHIPDPALRAVYEQLWRSEAGHHALFVELATSTATRALGDEQAARRMVQERLARLCREEAKILAALPVRAAVH